MTEYEYIESTLANIFNVSVGYGEEEAVEELKEDLNSNQEFKLGLEEELKKAFSDDSISWKGLCEEYNVCAVDTEAQAKSYIKTILWDVVFPSG